MIISVKYTFDSNESRFQTVLLIKINIPDTIYSRCVAVSQTEGYVREKSALLVIDSEGDTGSKCL